MPGAWPLTPLREHGKGAALPWSSPFFVSEAIGQCRSDDESEFNQRHNTILVTPAQPSFAELHNVRSDLDVSRDRIIAADAQQPVGLCRGLRISRAGRHAPSRFEPANPAVDLPLVEVAFSAVTVAAIDIGCANAQRAAPDFGADTPGTEVGPLRDDVGLAGGIAPASDR